MRYGIDINGKKVRQVHCKNHKCQNSKEKDGWFTPTLNQLETRIWAIEKDDGNDAGFFYCCNECKQECPLFNKTANQLIKKDQVKAGIIKETYYTHEEYQVYREEVLRRSEYKCEYCGEAADHVHHSRPQKLESFFSLDPDYGISCCKECHYEKGHKDECSTGQIANTICG